MGDFGQHPMANKGPGWSAPKAMGGGGGPPPYAGGGGPPGGGGFGGPPGGGGFGGPPGGGGFGGPPGGGGFGGPPGGGYGGPPGGGYGGPPRGGGFGHRGGGGGFRGGGGNFGGGGGFRGGGRGGGGFRGGGRGRGRGKPAPTNVVKKRKGYKGAAQKQKEPAKPSKQLFVRPVDPTCKVSEVRDYFQVFGELRDVYLPKDYYTKDAKGVAYVEYKEQEDAEEAQQAMDGCEFNGKNISVTFAQGDRKSKESMATGVYATNMEIEMLKKELEKESRRLQRAARGERISPPKFRTAEELEDTPSTSRRGGGRDRGDDRRGGRNDRRGGRMDRRGGRSRSRSPRRGFGGGGRERKEGNDCPEFRKRPDDFDDCPEFRGRPREGGRNPEDRRKDDRRRDDRGDRDRRRSRERSRDRR